MHFIFSLSRLECTALKTRAEMGCLPWYMPQGNTVFLGMYLKVTLSSFVYASR